MIQRKEQACNYLRELKHQPGAGIPLVLFFADAINEGLPEVLKRINKDILLTEASWMNLLS
jgi:hypothetical protein